MAITTYRVRILYGQSDMYICRLYWVVEATLRAGGTVFLSSACLGMKSGFGPPTRSKSWSNIEAESASRATLMSCTNVRLQSSRRRKVRCSKPIFRHLAPLPVCWRLVEFLITAKIEPQMRLSMVVLSSGSIRFGIKKTMLPTSNAVKHKLCVS